MRRHAFHSKSQHTKRQARIHGKQPVLHQKLVLLAWNSTVECVYYHSTVTPPAPAAPGAAFGCAGTFDGVLDLKYVGKNKFFKF